VRVVFPYCNHSDFSFGSPTGWDLNVAELFRRKGYEVCFGDGHKGVEEGLKADILFVYERLDLWTDERSRKRWDSFRQCADKILLGVFSPNNATDLAPAPENCLLVTPYRSLGTECLVLPYAHYDTKPEPGFDRKTIGWTTRNSFSPGHSTYPSHLAHLQSCCKLVEEGYKLALFSNHTYQENLSPEVESLLDRLRNSPLVSVADHLPYSQYISLLNQTSVVVPLSGMGSTTEALKLGSLPLAWNNVVNIYSNFPTPRHYDSLTYEEIHNKLFRLLTDEQFYRAEYQTLFDLAGIYDIEIALGMLDEVLDRL